MRTNETKVRLLVLVCAASVQPPWAVNVGLMWSEIYKWYMSNPVIVADNVFSEGECTLKLRCNEDILFISGGKCDTLCWALKRNNRLPISTRCIFFSRNPFAKNSTVKGVWWGEFLGWMISTEVFSSAHEWGQSALKELVLVCGVSPQPPWVVNGGLIGVRCKVTWNVERSHVPRSGNVCLQSPRNTTQITQGAVPI